MKIFNNFDFRLKASFTVVAAFLLLFFAFRLALFAFYHNAFANLSFVGVLTAFINGFRFDFAVIATFIMPCILLFNIPVNHKLWHKFWLSLCVFIFFAFFLVLAADFVYFGYVSKHITEEIITLTSDTAFLIKYAFRQTPLLMLFIFAGIGAALYFANKYVNLSFSRKNFKNITRFIVIILLMFFGIRGKIFETSKPIGIADAYRYAQGISGGKLVINGVFTAYHSARKTSVKIYNPANSEEAVRQTSALLTSSSTFLPDERYPLMRQINPDIALNKYNVFIVLLEGWPRYFIDSLNPGKNYGVTPNFDAFAKEGVVFSNAYASGMRSIIGTGSVFAGVPFFPNLPSFGYGLEMSALTSMGKDFNAIGYSTLFVQASKRGSFRLCSLAKGLMEMDKCYGREDYPMLLKYKQPAYYGYDYETLMFAADKVKKEDNFLALTFLAATHEPFMDTQERFEKYPKTNWENKFLNALYYSDFALGELINKAKEDGWFDNTVFIILSDHTDTRSQKSPLIKDRFKIPFIIYAPKILKPAQINYTVSQLDIIPTLYRLLGVKAPYTALGKDVFASSAERFAFVSYGMNIGLITDNGAIMHNGQLLLENQPDNNAFNPEQAQQTLLMLDKAGTALLKQNLWMK